MSQEGFLQAPDDGQVEILDARRPNAGASWPYPKSLKILKMAVVRLNNVGYKRIRTSVESTTLPHSTVTLNGQSLHQDYEDKGTRRLRSNY
jgi:hypothetical protein